MNQKKYEDHLNLGTLLSFHLSPGEEFSDQQGRDNDVGSESTISVDTSGTKNPETVSENFRFQQIKKFRNYLTPKKSQEVQEFI